MMPVLFVRLLGCVWPLIPVLLALLMGATAEGEAVRILGKVVDDATGKPIPQFVEQGGRVDPKDPTKVQWGFSEGRTEGPNADGIFRDAIDWAGGSRLRILADGYLPQPVLTEAPTPGVTEMDVTVRLKRGREVVGKVLDGQGKPVAKTSVFLVGNRPVNLTGGRAVRGFVGGDDPTVTKTATDADGAFTLTGLGDDETWRVAVSGPTIDLWVVPAPKDHRPMEVRLPQAGRLTIKLDIPGGGPEDRFLLQMKTYEMPGWEQIDNLREPSAKNPGEVTLDAVAPGSYELTRQKFQKANGNTYNRLCDRRTVEVKAGETAVSSFVRDRGAIVEGTIEGFDPANAPGTLVTVKDGQATGKPFAIREMSLPTFDFLTVKADGHFSTERLMPGEYTIVVEVFIPKPRDGAFRSGIDAPDFFGSAKVTVPAQGKPGPVAIRLKGRSNP